MSDLASPQMLLRSNQARWWLGTGLPVALSVGMGAFIVWLFFEQAPLLIVIGWFAGGLLGTAVAACIGPAKWVELRGTLLDVPGRGLGMRLVAPVTAINPARTRRRAWWQRLSGEQTVWFLNGEHVALNHRWFGRGQLQALLREVGCA